MESLGECCDRKVYYIDLLSEDASSVTQLENWICFAISSGSYPRAEAEVFIRQSLLGGMLEFKSQGSCGEDMHDLCDQVMCDLEVNGGHEQFHVCTTGDKNTDLANAFWECFFATALPDRADPDRLSVVCVSMDRTDYRSDLRALLGRFNSGWLPED